MKKPVFGLFGLEEALETAKKVIEKAAKEDKEDPISITVLDPSGKVIVVLSMDGAMPISVDLSKKKAHTALQTRSETLTWEMQGVDPSNINNSGITLFGGGVLIVTENNEIAGAIGVSGRKSHKESKEEAMQDHELATYGANFIQDIIAARRYRANFSH